MYLNANNYKFLITKLFMNAPTLSYLESKIRKQMNSTDNSYTFDRLRTGKRGTSNT